MLHTAAAVGLDVLIEIFFAVVVGELVARIDVLNRVYINVAALYLGLAVGRARVVDVARDVRARGAVDRLARIDLKQVLASA